MMTATDESLVSNYPVCDDSIRLVDWTNILSNFLRILHNFKINSYHIFNFDSNFPGF